MGEKDALGAKARNQAAKGRVNGIVFDAGGLIALERNDRRVFSILDTALEDGGRIIVPATALALKPSARCSRGRVHRTSPMPTS